jgi:hypothetical protein
MSRSALVVGIDSYPRSPLTGCVADAEAVARSLGRHHDRSLNFQVDKLLSSEGAVTQQVLTERVERLFERKTDVTVFYFAGHGEKQAQDGYLSSQEEKPRTGLSMTELIRLADASPAKERIIMLDSCHAGAASDFAPARLQPGVAVLAGCGAREKAVEAGGRGLFSSYVCDALDGGAADVRGWVNIAGVFAYMNEVLSVHEQAPLLHANWRELTRLRRAAPSVSDDHLRRITEFFPTADQEMPLDPSYEPREEPNHPENEAIFGILQAYRAARLLEPVGTVHMYDAAMESRACRLTPLGRFYWRSAKKGLI